MSQTQGMFYEKQNAIPINSDRTISTGAEYTYCNNMEIFPRAGFKPRVLTGTSNVNTSMKFN